ncbi:MAG TPA: cysteine desulfurase family protein [Acidimicrobiales bacterium]|nr:cysteine desulfurase family protein [Acidimicrobiales bacterium]
MSRHYLDFASTVPLRPEVRRAMDECADRGLFADPSRVHTEGRMARVALEDARDQVAGFFGVRPRQVVFTSGGTESVNSAVFGVAAAGTGPLALSPVEHSSVRDASARAGPCVTIPADGLGRIEPGAVADAIGRAREEHGRPPVLVHCQWANHEVGTVQPVDSVAEVCRRAGVRLHVDAAAAAGHVHLDLGATDADLTSVSAHKLGGPPGIGALIVRRGTRIEPFVVGGAQERARRAGMENLPGAVGFAAAAAALGATGAIESEGRRARARTDRLLEGATSVPGVVQFGDPVDRLPHLVCIGVEGVEAEPVLLGLDQAGIAVHSGSSCSSETLEPSPVLEAMGADAERSLRLSVGWSTTDEDVEAFAVAFGPVVEGLRALR